MITIQSISRLSLAAFVAAATVACGSSNSSGKTDTNTGNTTSSAMTVTSSSMGVSSMAQASSAPAVTESCNVSDGTYTECLDFESVAPGNNPEGFTMMGSGVSVVEGEGAYSGTNALKVSGSSASYIALSDFATTHWGRMYYKNTAKPATIPAGQWSHTTLVNGFGGGGEFRFIDMVAAPDDQASIKGYYQHLYNVEPNDLSLEGAYNNQYDGQWVCIEWSVDSTAQEFHLYKDGVAIELANQGTVTNSTDLADAKRWDFGTTGTTYQLTPLPAELTELRIGIRNYQGHNYTFLLDDIAIADERIGCEIETAVAAAAQ